MTKECKQVKKVRDLWVDGWTGIWIDEQMGSWISEEMEHGYMSGWIRG
jgi:hypothetical protein